MWHRDIIGGKNKRRGKVKLTAWVCRDLRCGVWVLQGLMGPETARHLNVYSNYAFNKTDRGVGGGKITDYTDNL